MKFGSLLKFETKRNFKNFLYFTIIWVLLIFLFMSFFDALKQSSAQIEQLYSTFPKELMSALGKTPESLTSIYGYIANQIMIYMILSGCIFTVFLSSGSIAGEIANRNIIFLLSKPLSRFKIYIAKTISIILNLILSNAILSVATILAIKIFTKEDNLDINFFILIYIALFLLELFFLGFAQFVGIRFNNGKAIAFGSLLVIVFYLLKVLSGITEQADKLKYLSLNYYIDLQNIIDTRAIKADAWIVLILAIIFIILGAFAFRRKDIDN